MGYDSTICAIIGTVRSLWTWLWGRYHVSQHAYDAWRVTVHVVVVVVVIVYLSVCGHTHSRISWSIFTKLAQT